jgi:hypothetical protein
MSTVIGIPPPDPPPDVPPLEAPAADAAGNAHQPTIREQMEMHRQNPACSGCHQLMDPFGFALEPFDAIGRWRDDDNGSPIVAKSTMYDGTVVEGPNDVREFLVSYSGAASSTTICRSSARSSTRQRPTITNSLR